jgi:hypothetical protein
MFKELQLIQEIDSLGKFSMTATGTISKLRSRHRPRWVARAVPDFFILVLGHMARAATIIAIHRTTLYSIHFLTLRL